MVTDNETEVQGGSATLQNASVIELALRQLKARSPMYERYHAYYEGDQPLTYTSASYQEAFAQMVAKYTENMCPAVVDAVADRLRVTGFSVEGNDNDPIAQQAIDLWHANRMDNKAGQVHTEALTEGDSYVIVWPDVETPDLVRIWPQDANGITCYCDEESGEMEWAAKWWVTDDNYGRLTLYFDDHIERYITNNKLAAQGGFIAKARGLTEFSPPQLNTFGRVPVFHFSNNPGIGIWGRSEIKNIIPVQDALNKAVCDMLVSMEYMAFPQRWATGIQVKLDEYGKPIAPWKPGVDRVWTTGNKDAAFGAFPPAELLPMLGAQNRFKQAIADISGTPSHYLQMSDANYPSGESLKTAEARFVSKIEDRQISFGNVWEDVIKFALTIMGATMDDVQLSTTWRDASPRSDMDTAQLAVLKKQVGIPNTQIQREMGYSEEDIVSMAKDKAAQDAAQLDASMKAFSARQPIPPAGGA